MSAGWRRAAVALGSNLGDREGHLDRAVGEIAAIEDVRVVAVSSWIETEPVDAPAGSPRFLNGALLLETRLASRELLARLQSIEDAHGRDRVREGFHGARSLDLDLLVVGDERESDPDLLLPHPRMEQRRFVLAPLAEIAPDLVLPSGRTPAEILKGLPA